MMQSKYIIIILLSTLFPLNNALAQCCSAGNPIGNEIDFASTNKNILKVSLNYKYSEGNRYYSKDDVFDVGFVDKAYFNYSEVKLAYGFSHRLSIIGELGYFINKTEVYKVEDVTPSEGFGLGDAVLQARYLLFKNFIKKWQISIGAGIKLPVGVFDQELNYVKLPITVQPSSGSFKYSANIFYINTKHDKIKYYSLGLIELANRINSKNFKYQYGNIYSLALGSNYQISKIISANILLRGELRARSERESDETINSTGGKFVYLSPGINIKLAPLLYLNSVINIPVYKYYNGIQLANSYLLNISIHKSISFQH